MMGNHAQDDHDRIRMLKTKEMLDPINIIHTKSMT
jgi:hypothetical protein